MLSSSLFYRKCVIIPNTYFNYTLDFGMDAVAYYDKCFGFFLGKRIQSSDFCRLLSGLLCSLNCSKIWGFLRRICTQILLICIDLWSHGFLITSRHPKWQKNPPNDIIKIPKKHQTEKFSAHLIKMRNQLKFTS